MGLFCSSSRCLFVILLLLSTKFRPFSSSTSISDQVLQIESRGSAGRHLLQAKKNCPVNFELLDYKILTNSCKGPNYPPDTCCPAFKKLACPYAEYLNDLTNNCASTLFSYINLYGKYPPGLFSNECREGKEGLACPAPSPGASPNSTSSGSPTGPAPSPVASLNSTSSGSPTPTMAIASLTSTSSGSPTLTTASNPFIMLAMLSASSLILWLLPEVC